MQPVARRINRLQSAFVFLFGQQCERRCHCDARSRTRDQCGGCNVGPASHSFLQVRPACATAVANGRSPGHNKPQATAVPKIGAFPRDTLTPKPGTITGRTQSNSKAPIYVGTASPRRCFLCGPAPDAAKEIPMMKLGLYLTIAAVLAGAVEAAHNSNPRPRRRTRATATGTPRRSRSQPRNVDRLCCGALLDVRDRLPSNRTTKA